MTKDFLIKIVKSKIEYAKYLLDKNRYESLSKDYLFSLIEHVDLQTYAMNDLYKKKVAENIYKRWDNYTIKIKEDMNQSINEYIPSKDHIKNLKPFGLTKNHNNTGIFNHDNGYEQNNDINEDMDMQNIHYLNQKNANVIRTKLSSNPRRIKNQEINEGSLNLNNNLEME